MKSQPFPYFDGGNTFISFNGKSHLYQKPRENNWMSINDILQLLNSRKQVQFLWDGQAEWQSGTDMKHERRELFLLI